MHTFSSLKTVCFIKPSTLCNPGNSPLSGETVKLKCLTAKSRNKSSRVNIRIFSSRYINLHKLKLYAASKGVGKGGGLVNLEVAVAFANGSNFPNAFFPGNG